MKKMFAYIAMFIGIYSVFLLATMPASFVAQFFPLPKALKIQQLEGTVWHSTIQQLQFDDIVLNNVDAKLSFFSLFLLSPSVDLTFGGALLEGPKGELTASFDGTKVTVTNAEVLVSAADYAPYIPSPIPVELLGYVTVKMEEISYQSTGCDLANGKANWNNAAVIAMDETIELANIDVTVGCDTKKLMFTVNPKNRLGLTLTAWVDVKGRMSGDGIIQPGENFPRNLESALEFVAQKNSQGAYPLKF